MHSRNLLAAFTLLLIPLHLAAAPGDLDPTFGSAGRVRVTLPDHAIAVAAVVQADGKIVAVGRTNPTSGASQHVVAVRLNADGSLDTGFDGDGFAIFPASTNYVTPMAVAVSSAGKILIALQTYPSSVPLQPSLMRLNADGSLDYSFGTNGVRDYPAFSPVEVARIRIQADGKIVMAGDTVSNSAVSDFEFLRFDAEGVPDTTFGRNGRLSIDFDQSHDRLGDFLVQPDGRIVAVARSYQSNDSWMSVLRLLANGQLDTAGAGGKSKLQPGFRDRPWSIYRQPDGKLLIAGETGSGSERPGMLVRLEADGTLDTSFGSGGRVLRRDSIFVANADENSRIFFAGEVIELGEVFDPLLSSAYAQALEADGSASTDFAPSGRTLVDFGHDDVRSLAKPLALVRLLDGRQLLISANDRSELEVVRLASTGSALGGVISVWSDAQFEVGRPIAVDESAGSVKFLVRRSGGASGNVSVNYAAVSSTAVAGRDFETTTGTLSWGDGETGVKTVMLPLIDDNDYEPLGETIDLQLSAPSGGATLGTARASVVVASNEETARIVTAGNEASESAHGVDFVVSRYGDARLRIVANYQIRAATDLGATPGVDFTASTGTITWEPNDTDDRIIHVPVVDDAEGEGSEKIAITVTTTSAGVQLPFEDATATIQDNDWTTGFPGGFEVSPAYVTENVGALTLRVGRPDDGSAAKTYQVLAELSGNNGYTSATPGVDYTLQTTELSWPAGDFSPRNVVIAIANDQAREGTEGILLRLNIGTGTYAFGAVRIQDAAPPPPTPSTLAFTQSEYMVTEDETEFLVSVARTGEISFGAEAEVWIPGGTASLTEDYSFVIGNRVTLQWLPGDAAPKTVALRIHEDALAEFDESIGLYMNNLHGGVALGPISTARVVIRDDDPRAGPAPTVGFAQDAISVSEDAPYVDLPIVRTALGGPTSFGYRVRPGASADEGSEFFAERYPYLESFSDSEPLTATRTIRIHLNGDARFEGDESFVVELFGDSDHMPIGRSAMTVTLVSNDSSIPPAPRSVGFVATTASQAENSGPVTLTVSRAGPTTAALAVHFETVAGTALAGSDFVAATGDLQWGPGDAADKTIVITLSDDAVVEPTETFTVRLSAPTNSATLAADTATISITNDDVATPPSGGGSGSSSGGGGGGLDGLLLGALALIVWAAVRRGARQGRRAPEVENPVQLCASAARRGLIVPV